MVSLTPEAEEHLKEAIKASDAPGTSVRVAAVRGPHG